MGLDMYLEGELSPMGPPPGPQQDGFPVVKTVLELGYWRKHPNLHGYIVQTFAEGVDECQSIFLGKEDCQKIAKAILEDELPTTSGFFFGDSEWHDGFKEAHAKIFSDAVKWLDDGKVPDSSALRSVFYRASW